MSREERNSGGIFIASLYFFTSSFLDKITPEIMDRGKCWPDSRVFAPLSDWLLSIYEYALDASKKILRQKRNLFSLADKIVLIDSQVVVQFLGFCIYSYFEKGCWWRRQADSSRPNATLGIHWNSAYPCRGNTNLYFCTWSIRKHTLDFPLIIPFVCSFSFTFVMLLYLI